MSVNPVIVIHGVATRDREKFEDEVAGLGVALGGDWRLIPVFWGGLGRPAEAVEDVLPYPSWLSDMKREIAGESLAGEFMDELRQAFTHWNLEEATGLLAERWKRYGTVSRRAMIGVVYSLFRQHYLAASAEFMGDVLFYQSRQAEIHAHIWECIMREAPGHGLSERPISVIAHSLGAVMLFDLAVAGHPALHLDHFITCGSQIPFFHVIGCSPPKLEPYRKGTRTTLPPTIRRWVNFYVPLDPWAFISAPAFRLHDGGLPEDIEVHAAERKDRLFKHAANYYWTHPVVVEGIKAAFGADRPA